MTNKSGSSASVKCGVLVNVRRDLWESGNSHIREECARLGEEELSRRGEIVGPVTRDAIDYSSLRWVSVRYTAQVIPNERA